jgi:hypothetical protein
MLRGASKNKMLNIEDGQCQICGKRKYGTWQELSFLTYKHKKVGDIGRMQGKLQ